MSLTCNTKLGNAEGSSDVLSEDDLLERVLHEAAETPDGLTFDESNQLCLYRDVASALFHALDSDHALASDTRITPDEQHNLWQYFSNHFVSGLDQAFSRRLVWLSDHINNSIWPWKPDIDSDTRASMIHELGQYGPAAADAVPHLAEALKDDAWFVRSMAAYALEKIGSAAKAAVPALRETWNDENHIVQANAATAVFAIDQKPDEVLPILTRLSQDHNTEDQMYAARGLGKLGQPGVPALIAVLEDSQNPMWLRQMVADILKENGNTGATQAIVPVLAKVLSDRNYFAQPFLLRDQLAAAKTLVDFGEVAGDAVPSLIALVQLPWYGPSTDRFTRGDFCHILGKILAKTNQPNVIADLQKTLAHPNRNTYLRRAAAIVFGEIGPRAKASVPALIVALNDADRFVRLESISALAAIGDKRALAALRKISSNGADSDLQLEAQKSYAQIQKMPD